LETLHGSIIRISAGSFNIAGNIQIEIKEAFTPVEILGAGLVTESNGKPLKSAGMIYLNALANGKAVGLLKPLNVSIPNTYYEPEMKVFKGVETDSGTINWVDPIAPDTTPQIKNWANGATLFRSRCASCHNIFKDGTGPSLKDVEYRGPWLNRNNIHAFMKNPDAYMTTSRYVQNLKGKFGSMMMAYPDLDREGLDAILDYIKNESARPGAMQDEKNYRDSIANPQTSALTDTGFSESISNLTLPAIPPCKDDTIYLPLPKQDQSIFEGDVDSLIKANTTKENEYRKPEDLEGLRNGFTDQNPTSGMYDFEIKTLGWYNIDAYVEGYAGTTNVKLTAQVRVDFDITMHVYLFCPKNKTLSVGYDKEGDTYQFNKINDRIPLFINDRAILYAFGSKGDKMYYGISEFNVRGEQTIIVTIKETTEEKIRETLYSKEIDGIDLGIEKKEQKIIKKDCDGDGIKKDTAAISHK